MSLWAFRFLLWYICIMIVQPQHRFFFLMPFRIANLCMIIATGLHVASCMTEGRPLVRFGLATKWALALLGFGLLSQYTGALQTNHAWNSFIDILVKNAYLLIMVEAMAYSVERAWAVFSTIGLASLWWIKGGLRLSAMNATWAMGDRIMGPAAGLVQDPNFFAYMMGVLTPLYLYFSRASDRWWIRWFSLGLAVSAVFIVLRTGSRAGLLELLVLGALLVPKYFREQKRTVLLAGLALFLLIPLSGRDNLRRFKTIPQSIMAFFSGEADLSGQSADTYSTMERRTKNSDTWALIKQYPLFGVGMNPNEALFEKEFWGATGQVHCEILMAGRQMGLIGMILHVGFLAIPFVYGRRIQKQWVNRWPAVSELGYTIKVQAAVFAVGGLFLPLPWHPLLLALGGCASGLWGALKGMELAAEQPAAGSEDFSGLLSVS
ncbi:MAG: O-antigen ligase family protein [Kiritimatiellae bacterium]|nr:O-antigen ligase family protein [Kiritimatiellia bacterium]